MASASDPELLSQFLAGDSRALETLIHRHTHFVYAVARRRVGVSHAEDVTQAVFILLVQKAASLRHRDSLLGWLHRAACLCSASLQRLERRRRFHEQESAAMKTPLQNPPPTADFYGLDTALNHLSRTDREVILLHYLSEHDIDQTAAVLHISPAAARKRAQRGLEKLRALLLPSAGGSTAALAGALQSQATLRAPATLAQSGFAAAQAISAGPLAGTTATAAGVLANETLRAMQLAHWTHTAVAAATLIACSLTAGILVTKIASAQPTPVAQLTPQDPAQPTIEPFRIQWNFISKAADATQSPPGLTDPFVSKNVLYFGDDAGTLRAVNAKDGAPIWESHHGTRIYCVTTDDQRLYFTTSKGVYAIQCANGKPAWDLTITGGGSEKGCALWPDTQSLFVGGCDGLVYALDCRTGDKMWTHNIVDDAPPDPPGFDSASQRANSAARPTGIITDGKTVYQSIFDQSRIVALDAQTGKQKWSFQTRGWVYPPAAFSDDFIFVSSQDKNLYCLKRDDGSKVWEFPTRNRIESAPVIVGKTVCVASCDGNLYCIDIATGVIAWNFQTDRNDRGASAIYSKPVLIHDALCFAAGEGQVYALSAAGQLLWKTRPSPDSELFTNPATDGTRLFITSRSTRASGGGRAAPGIPPLTIGESSLIALEQLPVRHAPAP